MNLMLYLLLLLASCTRTPEEEFKAIHALDFSEKYDALERTLTLYRDHDVFIEDFKEEEKSRIGASMLKDFSQKVFIDDLNYESSPDDDFVVPEEKVVMNDHLVGAYFSELDDKNLKVYLKWYQALFRTLSEKDEMFSKLEVLLRHAAVLMSPSVSNSIRNRFHFNHFYNFQGDQFGSAYNHYDRHRNYRHNTEKPLDMIHVSVLLKHVSELVSGSSFLWPISETLGIVFHRKETSFDIQFLNADSGVFCEYKTDKERKVLSIKRYSNVPLDKFDSDFFLAGFVLTSYESVMRGLLKRLETYLKPAQETDYLPVKSAPPKFSLVELYIRFNFDYDAYCKHINLYYLNRYRDLVNEGKMTNTQAGLFQQLISRVGREVETGRNVGPTKSELLNGYFNALEARPHLPLYRSGRKRGKVKRRN